MSRIPMINKTETTCARNSKLQTDCRDAESSNPHNGFLPIRIGFWGMSYYNYSKEPQKVV